MKITTIDTVADLVDLSIPSDMESAIESAIENSQEAIYAVDGPYEDEQEATTYLFLPAIGRGAVCAGGQSEWTDADSIEDLVDRWEFYDEIWSN